MSDRLTEAISAARSREDLTALLEALYEKAKKAYIDDIQTKLNEYIRIDLQKEGCIEVRIRIEVAKAQAFRIPTRRELLDAVGALYRQCESDDWHARVFEIHTRAFCDAILSCTRDRLYEIDSVKLLGDAERGFRHVQVRCSVSPD